MSRKTDQQLLYDFREWFHRKIGKLIPNGSIANFIEQYADRQEEGFHCVMFLDNGIRCDEQCKECRPGSQNRPTLSKMETVQKDIVNRPEEVVSCVVCELKCEPIPTDNGWSTLPNGRGIHFSCAESFATSRPREKDVDRKNSPFWNEEARRHSMNSDDP